MTDDERQVSALVGAWMAASNAGDPTAVLALMKDDVIFMISGLRAYVRNHIHITLTQQGRQTACRGILWAFIARKPTDA